MTRLTNKTIRLAALFAITAAISLTARAQTATWSNGAADNDWNNALNWDIGVPAEGTNAVIGAGIPVNYNAPMVATGFGALSSAGVLNVNAGGFASAVIGDGAIGVIGSAAKLFINNGGVVTASGGLSLSNAAGLSVASGGSLNVGGNFLLGRNATGNTGFATNNGGTISAANTSINPNNSSSTSLLVINGGTNDLGNVLVKRSVAGAGAPAVGTEGLAISNGLVRMTSLDLGGTDGNSWLTLLQTGGTVTNTGAHTMRQITAPRGSRFLQTGGLFVSSGTGGVHLRGHSANNAIVIYSVTGGTNLVEGFVMADPGDTTGTVNLTNAAKIYLGSGGMTSNVLNTLNVVLNNGGTFGASADWVGAVPMILAGGAFDCADLGGTPHNIALANVIRGTAALNKNGAGTLTLSAANTYSGNTLINQGTLALTGAGSIASSPAIILGSGTTMDVSGVTGGFTLGASRTLGGFGVVTGDVATASGAIINPGSNVVTGTLSFSNSVTQTGGTIIHFDLSTNPSGPDNDFIIIAGDLNASGANTMEISGGGGTGSVHPLIRYGGNFNGTVGNFSLSGASGTLSNNASLKTIYLVVATAIRAPTNVVWVGSPTVNDWDTINRTNWLNAGVLDFFVTGDNVLFDATGAANPNVNIVGNVAPASTTVGAATDYTFSGSGNLTGSGGLTKTNTGTLTINTTNAYSGPTTITGGALAVSFLGSGGANSSIGAASSDPANLILNGGTLRYLGGSTTTDRGATLNAGGGTIDIVSAGTVLTESGLITGIGTFTKNGPGTLALPLANSYGGGTLISNGTLRVDVSGAAGSAGVTNYNSTLLVAGAISFVSELAFEGSCVVDLNNTGGNTALNGSWSGSGTVAVINQQNSTRIFTVGGNGNGGGNFYNFTGTINMGTNGGTLRFNDGGGTGGGPNFGSTNLTIDLGTSTATFQVRNGGTTTGIGALLGGPDTRVLGRGSSSGTATYSIGAKNLSTLFEGSIQNSSDPTAIVKVGTGTLTLAGNSTHTGTTTVNEGTLQVDGSFSASAVTVLGGTLAGNGTFGGPVDIQSNGRLSPGASIGRMTINNSLTLQPGSTNVMELHKTAGTNDSIVGLISVTYGGTLEVTNLDGTLANGDTFKLFDAAPGSYFGAFDTIILPTVTAPLVWDTSGLTLDGTIKLLVPLDSRPAISSATIEGTDFVLRGTNNGNNSTYYYVLTSTNVAAPLSSWTAIATNQFELDGTFALTNAFNKGTPQRYYLLKTP